MRLLPDDPVQYLRQLGEAGDGPHDIAGAALMLSALDNPGRELGPCIGHLAEFATRSWQKTRHATSAESGAQALAMLFAGSHGYDGGRLSCDDPGNADLIAVIDRRRAYITCPTLARPGEPLHNEGALALEELRRRLN